MNRILPTNRRLPPKPTKPLSLPDKERIAVFVCLVLALAVALPPYLSNLARGMNSDLLILPDIYESLFQRGESWASWSIGGASYLFPDIPSFFLLALVTGDTYLAYIFLAGLFSLCLAAGFMMLGKAIAGSHARKAVGWFLCLFLLVTHPDIWPALSAFWQVLYHPYVHGGTYLLVTYGILLVFLYLKHGKKPVLVLLGFVCICGTMSDFLFTLYFSLPALSALAALALLHRFRRTRTTTPVLTIVGATLAGRLLIPVFLPNGHAEATYMARFGPSTAWDTTVFMIEDLVKRQDWLFISSALLSFAAMIFLGIRIVRMYRGNIPFSWRFVYLAVSAICSVVFGWAGILVTGNYFDPASWRYLIFPSTFVIVILVWSFSPFYPRWFARTGFGLFLILCLWQGFSRPDFSRPYPELAQFLDVYGGDKKLLVLAEYWTARQTSYFSRNGIRVEQIRKNGDAFYWANSLDTFRRIGEEPDRYVLVIMDHLDTVKIRSAYGTPAEEFKAGKSLIYCYPPSLAAPIEKSILKNLEKIENSRRH